MNEYFVSVELRPSAEGLPAGVVIAWRDVVVAASALEARNTALKLAPDQFRADHPTVQKMNVAILDIRKI